MTLKRTRLAVDKTLDDGRQQCAIKQSLDSISRKNQQQHNYDDDEEKKQE